MKKDAFWFSHDSNAKDDPKSMKLIDQLGLEGYGIYWVLIETLRDQAEYKYPLDMLPILARRYNTSGEKMKAVVSMYNLFSVDEENNFFSISLCDRMLTLDGYREQRRLAGIKSAEKRALKSNTTQRALNERCTDVQLIQYNTVNNKEDKTIQDKKDNKKIPPLFSAVSDYCSERNNNIDPKAFFDFYESKGWKIGKERMKDWQAAVRTWEQRSGNKPAIIPGEDPVQRMIREQKELSNSTKS